MKHHRYRVAREGAYLETTIVHWTAFHQGVSHEHTRHQLPVGVIVTFDGYVYSGGSDGIDVAQFRYGDVRGGFYPSSYGAPNGEALVPVLDEGPDLTVDAEAYNADEVVAEAARFGVTAEVLDTNTPWSHVVRYTGSRAALTGWFNDAYEDGSGDDIAARYLADAVEA